MPNLGEMSDKLAELKTQMDGINERKSDLQKEIDALEFQIITRMDESGVDRISSSNGTATLKVEMYPQVENMEELVQWCADNGRADMIQKRISSTAFKDFFDETNEYPDGVKTYEKKSILFRRK
jgi:predicted  nucleic acid-binding Zn-ribbon protein